MALGRTVAVGTVAWVAGITLLQAYLNEGGIWRGGSSGNFRVGFLPVT
jgi:hypothetical protein